MKGDTEPQDEGVTLGEAQHLHLLEGNPLTADESAMFAMFEREGWSDDARRAYLLDMTGRTDKHTAAE